VWTNLVLPDSPGGGGDRSLTWTKEESYAESMYIELDFHPLTVKLNKGVLMGIDQRMSLRNGLGCALYKMESKAHLIIPTFIRFLLSRGLEQEAISFARGFQHLEYFSHSLEVLLHQVLEEEAEVVANTPQPTSAQSSLESLDQNPPTLQPHSTNPDQEPSSSEQDDLLSIPTYQLQPPPSPSPLSTTKTVSSPTPAGGLLPQVVRFLEHFPMYLDVIVRCARKTEVALWRYFFGIVGDAKALFKRSLELGALSTATSYLIIIQTLESATVSGRMAAKLVDRAFAMEDFEVRLKPVEDIAD
ncbi:hypothetical protein HK102_001421, partial [Quaeritorhiza haematococci]